MNLRIKTHIYADGADLTKIKNFNKCSWIKGFTTNPSLIKKSGYSNYMQYARKVLNVVKKKPVSLEIFSDNHDQMISDALKLSKLAKNVYVKIPIINTKGISTIPVIQELNNQDISLNITAIFTYEQVKKIITSIKKPKDIILSIFAGRIADTGRDPKKIIKKINLIKKKNFRILWASTREIYSIVESNSSKCDIVTVPHDLLEKFSVIGKPLERYSLETVRTFYNDAKIKGYSLNE